MVKPHKYPLIAFTCNSTNLSNFDVILHLFLLALCSDDHKIHTIFEMRNEGVVTKGLKKGLQKDLLAGLPIAA